MQPYSNEQLREIYDRAARWFDLVEGTGMRAFGVQAMRARLLSRARGRVLDVAAGTGLNFSHLPRGCKVTAVDLSPGMLERARRRAERMDLEAEIAEMDALRLDFPDNSFDTVISTLSLCTIPEPVESIREMARVCAPDGRILLLEHGRSGVGLVGRMQDRWAQGHYKRIGCRWNQEPEELLREAGLEVLDHVRAKLGIFHAFEARPTAGAAQPEA